MSESKHAMYAGQIAPSEWPQFNVLRIVRHRVNGYHSALSLHSLLLTIQIASAQTVIMHFAITHITSETASYVVAGCHHYHRRCRRHYQHACVLVITIML